MSERPSDFTSYKLAELLSDLYHSEQTGVLALIHRQQRKQVNFERGIITFAQSSAADEDLGAVLLRDGRISVGALAEAKATLDPGATASDLARALIQRDLIGKATVSSSMAGIVDRVVQSAFGWPEGQATFDQQPVGESVFETDILTTLETILNGVLRMGGFDPVYEAMRGLHNRLRLCDPMPIPLEGLTLSSTHGFVLSRVDGATGLDELMTILPGEEEQNAARFIFGLLVLRVLEFDPRLGEAEFRVDDLVRLHADQRALERIQEKAIQHKYGQLKHQSPHQVLGVDSSAPRSEIERAYEQLKHQYSRDRQTVKVRDKMRTQISVIESRLVEAFLTLTQPAPTRQRVRPATNEKMLMKGLAVRVELDKTVSQRQVDEAAQVADSYYAKGRKCMREGDFHNAIQYGKLAISHNPSDARYFCLLADCQIRNPEGRWQRMAEENYVRATQLDPWNPEYWMSLGRLYKKRGMNLRARRNFEEALKLVPNKPEILGEISSLDT